MGQGSSLETQYFTGLEILVDDENSSEYHEHTLSVQGCQHGLLPADRPSGKHISRLPTA